MKALKWFLLFVLVSVAGCAWFLDYMGMFDTLNVTEKQMGPFTYAYEEFMGPYQNTMPVFARVKDFLATQGVTAGKGVGVYFDNPAQAPAGKLRSNCGAIIEETDPLKIAALQVQLKIGSFVQADCVVVEFPIKNSLSYMLAPMKVYPVMSKYISAKNYKSKGTYEIYDSEANKILYVIPFSR